MRWISHKMPTAVSSILLLVAAGFLFDGSWIYAKAWLAQCLIADAWQQSLLATQSVKPWPWADTWPVARLQASQHQIDWYVLNGARGSALAFGPAWLSDSAAPGTAGSTIIAGHRDTHFRFLKQLEKGDQLQLSNIQGQLRRYQVSHIKVVDSRRQPLLIDPLQSQLLLVTCYPFDAINSGGPLRYIVTATAINPSRTTATMTM